MFLKRQIWDIRWILAHCLTSRSQITWRIRFWTCSNRWNPGGTTWRNEGLDLGFSRIQILREAVWIPTTKWTKSCMHFLFHNFYVSKMDLHFALCISLFYVVVLQLMSCCERQSERAQALSVSRKNTAQLLLSDQHLMFYVFVSERLPLRLLKTSQMFQESW